MSTSGGADRGFLDELVASMTASRCRGWRPRAGSRRRAGGRWAIVRDGDLVPAISRSSPRGRRRPVVVDEEDALRRPSRDGRLGGGLAAVGGATRREPHDERAALEHRRCAPRRFRMRVTSALTTRARGQGRLRGGRGHDRSGRTGEDPCERSGRPAAVVADADVEDARSAAMARRMCPPGSV